MMDNVQRRLAEWIDSRVIAICILEELKNQNIEETLANGKDVWLDYLKNELSEGLQTTVTAIFK